MEGLESDQDCRDQGTKNEMIRCYTMQLFKNNRFYKLKINMVTYTRDRNVCLGRPVYEVKCLAMFQRAGMREGGGKKFDSYNTKTL